MIRYLIFFIVLTSLSLTANAENFRHGEIRISEKTEAWDENLRKWVTPEEFWRNFARGRGGLTWGVGKEYPPYSEVKEHDTFMVQLESGLCLMEFFHGRWRRANDVRRWDTAFNDYGGCRHVFE